MKRTICLIALLIMVGCNQQIGPGEHPCLSAVDQDTCCIEMMKDEPHDDCEGEWRFDSTETCKWICSTDTPVPDSGFCGSSTKAACASHGDCTIGGCSGQVCQGKGEQQLITTCEFRECYNSQAFGMECRCTGNRCMWTKIVR